MARRSKAREVALQLLFQREHNADIPRPDVEEFVRDRLRDESLQQFCLALFDGVVEQQEQIDRELAETAKNWRLSRMAMREGSPLLRYRLSAT